MAVPFIPNITACMKMTSFRAVVKNNLTLKTKCQYVIDHLEIKKSSRPRTILTQLQKIFLNTNNLLKV